MGIGPLLGIEKKLHFCAIPILSAEIIIQPGIGIGTILSENDYIVSITYGIYYCIMSNNLIIPFYH